MEMSGRKEGFLSMYTVRDVTLMGALIAVSGVFKGFWGVGRAQLEALVGPLLGGVYSVGFYMWGLLAAILVGKLGAGTIVMVLGTLVELAVGNPYGAMVFVYNFIEGLAADVGAVCFRYKLNGFVKTLVASIIMLLFGRTIFLAWLGILVLPVKQFPGSPAFFLYIWYYTLTAIGGVITGIVVWGIVKLLNLVGFKASKLTVEG